MREVTTMSNSENSRVRKLAGTAIALSLGLVLAGCGGMPDNRSLNSVH